VLEQKKSMTKVSPFGISVSLVIGVPSVNLAEEKENSVQPIAEASPVILIIDPLLFLKAIDIISPWWLATPMLFIGAAKVVLSGNMLSVLRTPINANGTMNIKLKITPNNKVIPPIIMPAIPKPLVLESPLAILTDLIPNTRARIPKIRLTTGTNINTMLITKDSVRYSDIIKNKDIQQDCSQEGVLGIASSMTGTLQVSFALQVLVGKAKNHLNKLYRLDAWKASISTVNLK